MKQIEEKQKKKSKRKELYFSDFRKRYRCCIVPMCKSTTISTRHKLFVSVPRAVERRKAWFKAARRDTTLGPPLSLTSTLYCCEDHFNMQDDMENYLRFKMMGGYLKSKVDVVPHKFACQTPMNTSSNCEPRPSDAALECSALRSQSAAETVGGPAWNAETQEADFSTNVKREPMDDPDDVSSEQELEEPAFEEVECAGFPFNVKEEPTDYPEEMPIKHELEESAAEDLECAVDAIDVKEEPAEASMYSDEEFDFEEDNGEKGTFGGTEEPNAHPNEWKFAHTKETTTMQDASESRLVGPSGNRRSSSDDLPEDPLSLRHDPKPRTANPRLDCPPRENDHATTHNRELRFACQVCDVTFPTRTNLKRHLAIHTTRDDRHVCNLCRVPFLHRRSLTAHMSTHTREDPLGCRKCTETFSRACDLKAHLSSHTREDPLDCRKCTETFTRACDLKAHLSSHTCDRPYGCQLCGEKFARVSDRTTHMGAHAVRQRLKCNMCAQSFACGGDLVAHIATHSRAEYSFGCRLCDKVCSKLAYLRRHVASAHAERESC